jgi:protocatechuate 3,4-dioxygenase beta subunit
MMREWLSRVTTNVVMLAIAAPIVIGQRDSTLLRTVRGSVLDLQGRTLASSVVYLYQQKTQAVRTQIADGNGQYRFSGLNPHLDYRIHAEHGDWISSAHRLSAADGKRDVVLDLKVDKRKTRMSLLPDGRAREKHV